YATPTSAVPPMPARRACGPLPRSTPLPPRLARTTSAGRSEAVPPRDRVGRDVRSDRRAAGRVPATPGRTREAVGTILRNGAWRPRFRDGIVAGGRGRRL